MADTKISALPASTTPLAGTELVPVVQSGTTKNVTVNNLTAGKPVSVGNITVTTAATTATGSANITSTDPTLRMSVSGGTADKNTYEWRAIAAGAGFDYLQLRKINDARTVFTELLKIDNDGNLTPSVAAKGVNFTANTPAAGMTSQLLNWYEEGTFTPTLGGSTTYTTQLGYYTRVGRQVTVQIVMTINALNTPTSAGQIRGLPFASANVTNLYQSGSVSYWSGANTPAYWVGCFINPNSTVIDITSTTSGAQASANDPFAIFKDGTNIMLSLTYFV